MVNYLPEEKKTALLQTLKLKSIKRAGWLRTSLCKTADDVESVAAHSWGAAWLALLMCPDGIRLERVLELALIHDLAEIITGDITPHDGISADQKASLEAAAFRKLTSDLPRFEQLWSLFCEYQECLTPEAVFVHRCDKIDMWMQAELYMQKYPDAELKEFVESAQAYLQKTAPVLRA